MKFNWSYFVLALIPVIAAQDDKKELKLSMTGEITKTQGAKAVVQCTSPPGVADADLKWFQGPSEITQKNALSNRISISKFGNILQLNIRDIEKNDAGRYICKGVINGNEDTKDFILSVYTGISVDGATIQQPKKGSTSIIKCIMKAEPQLTISWYLPNGTRITSDTVLPRIKQVATGLRIRNITEADNGVYGCQGVVTSHADQEFLYIDVKVTIPPTMENPPTMSEGKAGTNLRMSCSARGTPPPKYQWFRNDLQTPLQTSNRMEIDRDQGFMTITDLKESDAGTYRCLASNVGGNASGDATLVVLVPPTIKEIINGSAVEGGKAVFTCKARGKPAPSITFTKNGEALYLTDGDSHIVLHDDEKNTETGETIKKLEIKRTSYMDIGTYTCVARNKAGKASKDGNVMIQFPPNFADTPYVEKYSWESAPTELECRVNSNPLPLITWYKDGKEIEGDNVYTVTQADGVRYKTSTLKFTITPAQEALLFGTYTCEGSNNIGKKTKEITLHRATVPGVPAVIVSDSKANRIALLITAPPVTGGISVDAYKIQYNVKGEMNTLLEQIHPVEHRPQSDQLTPIRSKVDIIKLEAETDYTFDVQARNKVGYGQGYSFTHMTQKKSAPYPVDLKSSRHGQYADQYTLTWSTPDNGGRPLLKYIITWAKISIKNGSSSSGWAIDKRLDDYKGRHEIHNPATTSYDLTGLSPLSYYQVMIQATNNIGSSKAKEFIFRTSNG